MKIKGVAFVVNYKVVHVYNKPKEEEQQEAKKYESEYKFKCWIPESIAEVGDIIIYFNSVEELRRSNLLGKTVNYIEENKEVAKKMTKVKLDDLVGKMVKVKIDGRHADHTWNKKKGSGTRSLWRKLEQDENGSYFISYHKKKVFVMKAKDKKDGAHTPEYDIFLKSYSNLIFDENV